MAQLAATPDGSDRLPRKPGVEAWFARQVRGALRGFRRLHADLGVEVRGWPDRVDLRARDGPLPRSLAGASPPVVAGLHSLSRRIRQAHPRKPLADRPGRDRGADPRRPGRTRLLPG